MRVDLIFVNEKTTHGKINRIPCATQKEAWNKFVELDKTSVVKYAYIRAWGEWNFRIIKWYKKES